MKDAKAIRKHSAQHDLFNRLHSIAADESFVRRAANEWYGDRFERTKDVVLGTAIHLYAIRCIGPNRAKPQSSSSVYAYFKSTDGHTNNWNFNLRRSNLPLAALAQEKGGLILVDSTRRGKRMPDALSKTIPIWCTVINLAIQLRREEEGQSSQGDELAEWNTKLYLPPNIVSPSEKSQIEALIPGWAASLEVSTLPLPSLTKPLRPFFIHPATSTPPRIPENPPYTPIICLSASRWVGVGGDDVPSATRVGTRTVGFDYVPGAGDDDELWARGLKPDIYHSARGELLSADRDDLPDLVDQLVDDAKNGSLSLEKLAISTPSPPQQSEYIVGVPDSRSKVALDLGRPASLSEVWERSPAMTIYIVETIKPLTGVPALLALNSTGDLLVPLPNPRSDGKAYSTVVQEIIASARRSLSLDHPILLKPARLEDIDTAIRRFQQSQQDSSSLEDATASTAQTAMTGAELIKARKVILPVMVALDCAINEEEEEGIDKSVIADSLHRLVALWPDGNPPRAALKRINEVLMSGDRGSR